MLASGSGWVFMEMSCRWKNTTQGFRPDSFHKTNKQTPLRLFQQALENNGGVQEDSSSQADLCGSWDDSHKEGKISRERFCNSIIHLGLRCKRHREFTCRSWRSTNTQSGCATNQG